MIIFMQICFKLEDNTSPKTLKDQREEISIASEIKGGDSGNFMQPPQ